MEELRLTFRLKAYWDQLRHDQAIPDIHQLDPKEIADIWPSCFRVQATAGARDTQFTYDYMGKELVKIYGKDMTGTTVDRRMPHFPGSVLHERLENVVLTQSPMQDQGHLINYDGKLIRYRACLLPFGNAKGELTHIVCALTYRYFDQ